MKQPVQQTAYKRPNADKKPPATIGCHIFSRSLTRLFVLCLFATLWPISACKRAPLPPPVVLFDQGHGQHFLVGNQGELDLSKLGETFTGQGFQLKTTAPNQAFTDEALARVSTLIISGAFKPINDSEIQVIKKFIDQGGQLCVMLHIGSPFAALLNGLGVDVSNGVIRERSNLPQADAPTDFFVTDLAAHPISQGITQLNLYGAWALNTELAANVIAKTSPTAWVDLNNDKELGPGDASQAFSVVVSGQLGHGHFLVFGDDAIFQNRFLTGQNQKLAVNLVTWLKAGSNY
jgi:hypothetical protein